MLTMEAIRKENYKIFNNFPDDIRVKQEHSLKYIEQLGLQTGTDVSKWEVLKIFAENGELPTQKNTINTLFFKHLEINKQEKKVPKIPEKVLVEDLGDVFQKFFYKTAAATIKILERDSKSITGRTAALKRDVEKNEANILRNQKSVATITEKLKTKIDLEAQVKAVLADGFWTLSPDPKRGHVSFLSPEIRLSYKRDKQNALLMVNMGTYQINIAPNSQEGLYLFALPFDQNPRYDGLHHPHVDSSGTVCFGDQADRYWNASREYDIVEVMRILRDVICDYNQDSAYVQLNRFQEAAERKDIFDRAQWIKDTAEIREVLLANRITDPIAPEDEEDEVEPIYDEDEEDEVEPIYDEDEEDDDTGEGN